MMECLQDWLRSHFELHVSLDNMSKLLHLAGPSATRGRGGHHSPPDLATASFGLLPTRGLAFHSSGATNHPQKAPPERKSFVEWSVAAGGIDTPTSTSGTELHYTVLDIFSSFSRRGYHGLEIESRAYLHAKPLGRARGLVPGSK